MMGPVIPAGVLESRAAGTEVPPDVKSAVDTLLSLWGTSNSKGSHQRVLRDFSDSADGVPVDPSKASDADRLKYAMQILEAGQNAKTQFSSKGLNRWKEAVAPLMSTYAPAQKFQWIGTTEDGGPDYGQWAQIASSVGFNGPTHIEQSVPSGYDENGNQTFSVGYGISPEFKAFVDKAHEQGYGFVQHADNIVNFNQRYGFRLPDGSIQGQYSVRDDQSVRDFGMSLLPIASMMLGVPGIGGALAQTIGSTVLPASAAAAASTAINTALASTGLSVSAAAVTSAVGQAAIQSGLSALGGGDTQDVIRAGITGLVGNAVAPAVNAAVPGSLGALEKVAERAITSATLSAISGQGDPEAAALGSLTSSLPGATGVPPALLQGALQLATTGTVTPSALINAATSLGRTSGTSQTGPSIGASYDDPSRTTDVVAELEDILGTPGGDGTLLAGPMDAMDFSAPNRAEQKTQVADYIRNQAASGVAGFKVGPGGVLEVEDRDRGITHRFTSDGSVLGSVDTVFGSRTGEFSPTSAGVKEFLSSPYVQGLFQGSDGSAGDVGRYMVREVSEDGAGAGSITQEQSDELLRQAEQDLMEEELYQVNSPVTMPSTAVDTTGDYGQSVFAQIDQPQAASNMTTDQVQQIVVDTLKSNPGVTTQQVQSIVDGAVKSLPAGLTQQDVTTAVNDAIARLPKAPTQQDIDAAINRAMTNVATQQDVRNAIAGIQFPPGITQQDVTSAISQYMQQNPGLSAQDVAAQVSSQLAKLPAYATPADVNTAISSAMSNVATRADVQAAIQGIQFPAGINEADVTRAISDYMRQNPGLSAQDVAAQVADQLKTLPAYATPADVESAIQGAMTNVATRADVEKAIQGIQFPTGISRADVTDAITQYMRDNPGLSADEVTSLVGEQLSRLPAFATPQDVESTVRGALAGYATSEDVSGLGRGLEAVRADLTQLIADAQASGLKGDAALNASLEALAGELGTTRKGLMDSLGVTESALRSEFASQIGGVQTQMTELGQSLQSAIADARSAGLLGDEALQVGLESLAGRLGTTRDDLLATLGATEQSLRSDFASQLGGVSSQISNVQTLLLDKINAAYSVGLQGDEALRAGLDSLAADLGTTQANLLSQLGTTEAALRSQFGSQIGEVRTQVGQLGQDLQAAIDSARRSGLQGDAALQAGLDTLAGSLGTTRSELLSQLGTTEQALRSDFASQLGGVQSQVTQLGSDLSSAIESARAAGLQGDAALQAGLDTLANRLGTTTDQLLSQLGTTESALRSQFGAQIGEVQTQVGQLGQDLQASIDSARRAGLQGDAALQAGLDTLANRLGTTTDQLLSQLGATEQGLRSQFAGQLGEVQSSLTGQIGGVEERLNSRIEDLVDQGVDFQTATNQALKEVTGSIETLTEQQQQESERTQTAIGSVEERLGDRINQLMQQGLDWQEATNLAIAEVSGSVSSLAEETQSSIGALGLDVESQIEEFRRAQEAADAAAAETARQQAAEQKSATEAAVARAVQQSAEEAAARDAARQAAADDQSRRDRLMGLASSFIPQGTSSNVSDPYKATFLAPFIVGGKAPEKFEGALSGFLKEATTGDFLPDKPQQSTRLEEDQQVGADQYFGGPSASANPLDLYQPEQEYAGLFGFRAGGMVPFMAQGGTRYGHNAHGALNVLEHSGKHRVDYRQGDAVTGIGDGQSDDIPAMLADGEFVIPADVVAALGNGSTKAGSDKLYEMMHNIRRHHRSAGPKDLPPPAKAPLEYIKSRKGRSA